MSHDLLQRIHSNDANTVLTATHEAAPLADEALSSALRHVLAITDDPVVRNGIALALSDAKDALTSEVLVALLKSPRTAGARGTLLYAMGAYPTALADALPLLVECVVDGNFEESRQALALIEGIDTELSASTWRACVTRVRSAIPLASSERLPLLEQLAAMLEA